MQSFKQAFSIFINEKSFSQFFCSTVYLFFTLEIPKIATAKSGTNRCAELHTVQTIIFFFLLFLLTIFLFLNYYY
jgi:hypothetical protein